MKWGIPWRKLRGGGQIPTVASAARTGHIQRQPAVSFTYYEGIDLAVIAHGEAAIIQPDHPDFAAVETLQREVSQESVQDWGEGIYVHIQPRVIYTYARYPERFAEA